MKPMKDYHDLYLICIALYLVDIFEKFRNICCEIYSLCPLVITSGHQL